MGNIRTIIEDIVVCPSCHGELKFFDSRFECPDCARAFPIQNGIQNFLDSNIEKTADSQFQTDRMFESTLTAKIHNVGRKIINSEYMPKKHISEFIKGIEPERIIVELGSGNRRLRDDVINVDLFPFPNVDLMADVLNTPFRDNSIEFAFLDTVLEHVPEPHAVVREVYRILKTGGQIVCIVPWVFPYHGYPKNYFNISRDGLEFLFRDFSECKIEMSMGPTSALTNLFSEYFAVALSGNHKILYSLIKGLVLLPVFLLKYLDKYWYHSGKASRIAAALCIIAEK